MSSMAEETVAGTDAGGDSFEREFEEARAAQSGPIDDTQPEPGAPTEEAPTEAEGEKKAEAREPLPPEEVEKRWRDTQAALKAERKQRQEDTRARQALEQQLAELKARIEGGDKPAEGPPDPNQDPLGALEWLQKRIAENDAREAEKQQQTAAQQREAEEVRTLTREFTDAEAEFREETPDYDEAVKYLREARVKELVLFGHSEAEAIQLFGQEVIHTLRDVKARGLNPAQVAYGLARQRGYAPKPAAPNVIETIAKGQAAAKTLSGTGGKGNGELTVESVSNLKGAAFDAAFAKLMAQERERERRLG